MFLDLKKNFLENLCKLKIIFFYTLFIETINKVIKCQKKIISINDILIT